MGSRSDLTWGTKRTYGERGNEGADGRNEFKLKHKYVIC